MMAMQAWLSVTVVAFGFLLYAILSNIGPNIGKLKEYGIKFLMPFPLIVIPSAMILMARDNFGGFSLFIGFAFLIGASMYWYNTKRFDNEKLRIKLVSVSLFMAGIVGGNYLNQVWF